MENGGVPLECERRTRSGAEPMGGGLIAITLHDILFGRRFYPKRRTKQCNSRPWAMAKAKAMSRPECAGTSLSGGRTQNGKHSAEKAEACPVSTLATVGIPNESCSHLGSWMGRENQLQTRLWSRQVLTGPQASLSIPCFRQTDRDWLP